MLKVGRSVRPRFLESPASCASSTQSGPSGTTVLCRQNLEDAIFGHSLKTYGWVYLVVAAILLVSAVAIVIGRSQIGRWIGVAAGAIAAISAIWWMPYYPVWSLT